MTLEQLMAIVGENWVFDEARYPERTSNITEQARKQFGLEHLHKHLSKSAGQLAAIVEPVDHGEPLDTSRLSRIVRNLLIVTINLARVGEISPEDIVREVRAWEEQA